MRSPARHLAFVTVALLLLWVGTNSPPGPSPKNTGKKLPEPNDWFLIQRAWPHADIPQAAWRAARDQAQALQNQALPDAGTWQPAGPTNVGGRIADVCAHPTEPTTCYAGAAAGGVFKTTDGGLSWFPTFDDQATLSIGSIAIDPVDPEVVYVGTGEPNGGGGSVTYGGTGVYKSENGGVTWNAAGLEETRAIGRVRVAPSDPSRIYVAALGALFSTGPDRGVYRSTDAGSSWDRVLASTDSTGAVDIAVHPQNPDIVYAALWERIRRPHYRHYGGPSSGVYRSTDGGDSWEELTAGLPAGPVGRIGLALSPSDPDILYAIYADPDPGAFLGVFRSDNGGDTFVQTQDGALGGVYATYGWWFGNIRVHPTDPNLVFVLGLDFYRSTNGGQSWQNAGSSMHVDHHGLDFAAGGSLIYEGNDGGMYLSANGGTAWNKLPNLPLTQFYTVEVDHQFPERRYGGTQDNGTNRTLTGGLDDWQHILGGDGFHCQVDPTNNNYVYAEWQWGGLNRSVNGGASFSFAGSGLFGRTNWSMPVMLDPHDPTRLYAGTDRVFRSTNRAQSWSAISPDLTDGDGGGNAPFGTVTTVAASPVDADVLWAGTDDGNVWVSTVGGAQWTQVDGALPDRWITRVVPDPVAAQTAYVTISGFRWDEPLPHVFRTTDAGQTWMAIAANLPEAPVNDLVIDPAQPATLIVATDFGVYATTNLGSSWAPLGIGLPNVVVTDLELHVPSRTLVAATFGRSMWTYDLDATAAVATPPSSSTAHFARLRRIYPNPLAAGPLGIDIDAPADQPVTVKVYTVGGRAVANLTPAGVTGRRTLRWDGRDAAGRRLAAGVYLVNLRGAGVNQTRRLHVIH